MRSLLPCIWTIPPILELGPYSAGTLVEVPEKSDSDDGNCSIGGIGKSATSCPEATICHSGQEYCTNSFNSSVTRHRPPHFDEMSRRSLVTAQIDENRGVMVSRALPK